MSIAHEGRLKVLWADDLASLDPDATPIPEVDDGDLNTANGAVNLTPFLPVAGVDRPSTQNNASLAMLDDAFISEEPGTWSVGPVTLTFVRDPGSEDSGHPWQIFEYGKSGYLITHPDGLPTVGDEVTVYKVGAHEPVEIPSAENTKQQASVAFAVERMWRRVAVVAGS